jgi:hypothetical protein
MRLKILAYITWLLYSSIIFIFYINIPPNPDQSIFDYVAKVCVGGGRVYTDAGDINFPGAVWLHVLARLAFGDSVRSYRILDYISLLIFIIFIYKIISDRQGKFAAIVFVPVYQAMYVTSDYWIAGQRDLLCGHLVLVSGFLLLKRVEGGPIGWLWGVGMLIWVAMLLKPTYLIFLPVLFFIDIVLKKRSGRGLILIVRDHAVVILVVGVLSGVMALWGWELGVLYDWFDMAILFNAQSYGKDSQDTAHVLVSFARLLRQSWHWYAVFAMVGSYLWWRSGDRPSLLVILGTFVTVLGSAVCQGKGFSYHFGGVLPVLGILAANCVARLAACSRAPHPQPLMVLAATAALVVLPLGLSSKLHRHFHHQLLWKMNKISIEEYFDHFGLRAHLEMAKLARARTSPDETVLVYGNAMLINMLSDRMLPVRFAPPQIIALAKPPFCHANRWQDEWEASLRDHPPRLIILPGYAWKPWPDGLRALGVMKTMIEGRYEIIMSRDDLTCFERTR